MYEYLRGVLQEKNSDGTAVVECAGVGYALRISTATYDLLPSVDEVVRLPVRLIVNSNSFESVLYAFVSGEERLLFDKLLTVKGIGAKGALAILSAGNFDEIVRSIRAEDIKSLCGLKGIGNKTAKQMVVELKPVLDKMIFGDIGIETPSLDAAMNEEKDIALALLGLGYAESQAEAAARIAIETLGKESSMPNLIKEALTHVK